MQNQWTKEVADQASCIDQRLVIASQLIGRSDIRQLAKALIELQDGKTQLSNIALSRKQMQLGEDIASLVGPVWTVQEKGHPPGLKLPLLAFSPYYLLHTAKNSTALNTMSFPRHHNEIVEYLHETLCHAFVGNVRLFRQVVGFTIDQMASFLCYARTNYPVLFLLVLSRETELACKLIKEMPADPEGQTQSAALRSRFFPQAKVDLGKVLELLRNLQRATQLIVAVGQMSGFNARKLKRIVADLENGKIQPGDEKFLQRINVTVAAVRKIVLLDIDRHNETSDASKAYKFERGQSDEQTLDCILCLTGQDRSYSAKVVKHCRGEAVLNLPTAPPPPQTSPIGSDVKPSRQPGRGGPRINDLANYYGFTRDELAMLLAIITYEEAGTKQMAARQTAFATAILAAAGYDPDEDTDIRDRVTNRLKLSDAAGFPSSGQMLHSVGFRLDSWKNLERDKTLWKTLATSSDSSNGYGEFFLQCRDYFYLLTHRVSFLKALERAAQVFCHMSHCVGLLSSDPIWIRLLQRAKLIAKPSPSESAPVFGPGPPTLQALVDLLDPIPKDD